MIAAAGAAALIAIAGVGLLAQPEVVDASRECTIDASHKWGPIELRKTTCVETTTTIVESRLN